MPRSTLVTRPDVVLSPAQWGQAMDSHAARADHATAARRQRVSQGATHPVDDFMYDYYGTQPRRLRRWHPGPGIVLEGTPPHSQWRWYRTTQDGVSLDLEAWWADRGAAVAPVRRLLQAVAGRQAQLGCFGMHEWAMVYGQAEAERRHHLPLRLGDSGTDAVVERHPLVCTHFDAYRFFTPPAVGLNAHTLTRESQVHMDQPGCLHVSMDLYKWAMKLVPAVDSDLLMDCFELAREIRTVDMQASPYDLSSVGLDPIAVETPAGKSLYARLQADFAQRAGVLRERLIDRCTDVMMQMEAI